jgi:hypothetical protein
MKQLLIILVLLLVACNPYTLTTKQYKSTIYSTSGWCIYKNDTTLVGEVVSIEYELYKGKLVKEISISLESLDNDITDIIKYLHTKDPTAKIEINTDKFDLN